MLMVLERSPKKIMLTKKAKRTNNRYAKIPSHLPYPNHPMVQMQAAFFTGLPHGRTQDALW